MPLDGLAPLARGFEGGLDGFDAGVHGQGHLEAGEVVEVAVEERELVVAEGAGGEGDLLGLLDHGCEDGGVAVALVDGGVGGEEVEVATGWPPERGAETQAPEAWSMTTSSGW